MGDFRVMYGEHSLVFSISYRKGLAGKVRIHVQPDTRVVVDAPPQTRIADIKKAVLKRARWIVHQISKLQTAHRYALHRQYVSGESHWYLGKRYLLKVRKAKKDLGAKLMNGQFVVTVQNTSATSVETALDDWYRVQARHVFARRLYALCSDLHWVQGIPEWQLCPMRKQWGSCSPKGKLSLNPMLVKVDRSCIDYVILHELCHRRHHNHSHEYYALLARQLPDWKQRKTRLDNLAERVLS